MIPYDDLVVALQAWRARQGLPVAQFSGSPAVAAAPAPAPAPMVPKGPPMAPPRSMTPPPLAATDTEDEPVDDAALLEEAHYDNEGDDFAMAFGKLQGNVEVEDDAEQTAIGTAPARDSFGGATQPEPPPPPPKRKRSDSW